MREIQRQHAEWMRENFGTVRAYRPLLGIVEEVGELAHAHLKARDGIAARHDAKDAVGDIAIFLMGYCTCRGWDFQAIVEGTWREVSKRDHTKSS